MSFDSGINVSEVECVELTQQAMSRADSLGGSVASYLSSLLPNHPESWYHAALELGYCGRPNDAIDCWLEYVDRTKKYVEDNLGFGCGDFSTSLIWGVECIRDLGVRHKFLDSQYIAEVSLNLIRQANDFGMTEKGLQIEVDLLNRAEATVEEILSRIERFLVETGDDSVVVPIVGWLSETHGSDEDEFNLQSVADDYAALGNFNDAFRLWSKLSRIKDPSSQIIQLLWYCVNNGIEIDKEIAEESIFDDKSVLGDVESLRNENAELQMKLEESKKKINEMVMEAERIRLGLGQLWSSIGG